jgi:hypothetical protein
MSLIKKILYLKSVEKKVETYLMHPKVVKVICRFTYLKFIIYIYIYPKLFSVAKILSKEKLRKRIE